MNATEFNTAMYERFPELGEQAKEKFDYFGDEEPGYYITFEGLLVPEIEKAAATDPQRLQRLMDFVEDTAQNRDMNLVTIGLGEWLPQSKHEEAIRKAAGPATQTAIFLAERARVRGQRNRESSPVMSFFQRILRREGFANAD